MAYRLGSVASLTLVAIISAGCTVSPSHLISSPLINQRAGGIALGAFPDTGGRLQLVNGAGGTTPFSAGGILGGAAGSEVIAQLSREGQLRAERSTQETLNTAKEGESRRWEDPQTGIYGVLKPTSGTYRTPARQVVYPSDSIQVVHETNATYDLLLSRSARRTQHQPLRTTVTIECRNYESTLVAQGRSNTVSGRVCRSGPGSSWQAQF